MTQATTQTELRILLLEDSPADAELNERELRKAGLNFTAQRVESRDAFARALKEFLPDIILSDYNLPGFSGLAALEMVKRDYPDTPVIIITGALSDKEAVELLQSGAQDYVLKDRLARLASAVQHVLLVEQGINIRKLAEAQLHEKTELLENVINSSTDYIFVKDRELRTILCNDIFAHALGKKPEELYGKTDIENGWDAELVKGNPEKGIRGFEQDDMDALAGNTVHSSSDLGNIGEEIRYFDSVKVPLKSSNGEVFGMLGISRDVTERKRTEEDFQRFFNLIPDLMCIASTDGHFLKINPMWQETLGFTEQEILAMPFLDLIHPEDRAATMKEVGRQLAGEATMQFTNRYRCKDGSYRWLEWRATPAVDKKLLFASARDITQKRESDEIIWRQANFDALTGLPNRHMFRDRLQQEIKKASRAKQQIALMFIDLDRFKEVNDALGHDAGDTLLVEAAHRIADCVRATDIVSRFGGDEFTVLLVELDDADSVERIATSITHKLAAPFRLKDEMSYVSASVGITLYPDDGDTVEDLFKNADQAMYAAKSQGRNRHSYFTSTMQEAAQTRLRLVSDLRSALAGNQFMVYFQPIVELATGNIHKAEALIRWKHPERGIISPAEFIPLAEETGLIFEIGDWVFHESMRWAKRWRAMHNPALQISVNKSPVQFYKDGEDHSAWLTHLSEHDLPGQSLAIEITEGLLLDKNISVTGALLTLRNADIQVSIDDFGTGYSSLSYLNKFDIDYLKIDQSFTRGLAPESSDLALSEAIIVMAHKLGMKVIAEGVETKEQREILAAAGCDYAQGYFYSRPVAPEEFEKLLRRG